MIGIALVILGVAIVNHPRAEPAEPVTVDGQAEPFDAGELTYPTPEVP
jgi:hypothetical protein